MDDQNKNLILAMVLSSLVLVVWMVLFAPEPGDAPPGQTTTTETAGSPETAQTLPSAEAGQPAPTPGTTETAEATAEIARVPIATPSLAGSISLAGGRIDQLSLSEYNRTLAPGAANVTLLSPVGSAEPYYAVFGWLAGGALGIEDVPGNDTIWSVESGETLTPGTSAHASMGQPDRSRLPPHRRGGRPLHVHDHPDGRECHGTAGPAGTLRHRRASG